MNRSEFWKNFELGTEIDIAGSFIFNGLRRLHEMESLYHESEVFEFLYNLAVGIERLLKVAVILIEHDEVVDQEEFEQSLITHSHQDLVRRVREKHEFRLASSDNEFLDLLGRFYRTHRYGRFAISAGSRSSEKKLLHKFVGKNLDIEIRDEFPLLITPNDSQIRKFIGRRVAKITKRPYEIICEQASRLRLYTHELRSGSKAEKIFLREQFDFCDEDVLWRELLLFILHSDVSTGMIGFMKSLEPLPFDPGLISEYLQCFASEERKLQVLDELDHHYDDVENVKLRLEKISVIGASNVFFDDEEDDDEFDYELGEGPSQLDHP